MLNIQTNSISPKKGSNQINHLKKSEVTTLINSLSSIIKSYFTLSQTSLSDVKKYVPSHQHGHIDRIGLILKSFITESKDIFDKINDIRKEETDNHSSSPKSSRALLNKSRNSTKQKPMKSPSPLRSISSLIDRSINGRTTLFSDSVNKNNLRSNDKLTNSSGPERALSLANGVIYFLSQIKHIEDLIVRKSGDADERKRQFEIVKGDLMDLAQDILTATQQEQTAHQRPQSQALTQSQESLRTNVFNSTQSLKHTKESPTKLKEINEMNSRRSPTNDGALSVLNKMKKTILELKQENNELKQKSKDLSIMWTVNSGTNTLIHRLKEKEKEIRVLRQTNMKTSFDKYKIFNENCNKKLTSNGKRLCNSLLSSDRMEKREDQAKLGYELQTIEAKNDLNDNQYDSNGLHKEGKDKEAVKEEARKRYNSNVTFTFNNNSYSDIQQGNELNEKSNKQTLNHELSEKNKEIDLLAQELLEKKNEIASCIKEFHQIRSNLERDNTGLKEELEHKAKECQLLLTEVKALNEQIATLNIQTKPNAIILKNTLEFKKLHDELFKERRKTIELSLLKKQQAHTIALLQNDLTLMHKETEKTNRSLRKSNDLIEHLTIEMKGKDIENKALKEEVDNCRIVQAKICCAQRTEHIEELKGKDILLEYLRIKEDMIRFKNEKEGFEKSNATLNKQLAEKDSLIIHLKLQNSAHSHASHTDFKELEFALLNKINKGSERNANFNEGVEAVDVKAKDNKILELNNNLSLLNEMKIAADIKHKALLDSKEAKLKEMTSALELEKEKSKAFTSELQSLQSAYEQRTIVLDDKLNQIDRLTNKIMVYEKELKSLKASSIPKQIKSLFQPDHSSKEISPETHSILCDKTYKDLHWYLLTDKSNLTSPKQALVYSNTQWIESTLIEPHIEAFNKFTSERELEEESLSHINTIQSNLLKKLEEKDDEVIRIRSSINKLKDKHNDSLSNNEGALNRGFSQGLFSSASPYENMNLIPMEKYEKITSELHEAKDKLAKSAIEIHKLTNDNQELMKIANSKMPRIEPSLSLINNNEAKSGLSLFDDNALNSNSLRENKSRQVNEPINHPELKRLMLLLIQEITYTPKIKRMIYEIGKIIGLTDEEALRIIIEKEKRGSLLGFFKKK